MLDDAPAAGSTLGSDRLSCAPVAQYLSDEWIERADAALAANADLAEVAAEVDLTIQYEVSGAPVGKRSYALRLERGTASIEDGPHPDAPVTFTLDYRTAAAIARGETSAQAAFMRGDLKLGGDMTVLIRQHDLLGALDDAMAELRADTDF